MDTVKSVKILLTIAALAVGSYTVNAQQNIEQPSPVQKVSQEESTQGAPKRGERNFKPKNPRASDLDISHAIDDTARFHRMNRSKIFALNIVVANFGFEEDRTDFENIKQDFKNAVRDLYKGHYVAADRTFRKNLADIKNLFERLANVYHQRTLALLNDCADALVELEFSESVDPSRKLTSKAEKISKSRIWLRNGFTQISEGEIMQLQDLPEFAISNYRIAKMYGIGILKELSPDDASRKEIENKYSVDSEDIKRMVARNTEK